MKHISFLKSYLYISVFEVMRLEIELLDAVDEDNDVVEEPVKDASDPWAATEEVRLNRSKYETMQLELALLRSGNERKDLKENSIKEDLEASIREEMNASFSMLEQGYEMELAMLKSELESKTREGECPLNRESGSPVLEKKDSPESKNLQIARLQEQLNLLLTLTLTLTLIGGLKSSSIYSKLGQSKGKTRKFQC